MGFIFDKLKPGYIWVGNPSGKPHPKSLQDALNETTASIIADLQDGILTGLSGSYTGSFSGSFTGSMSGSIDSSSYASTASYVPLIEGDNITINYTLAGIEISSSAGGGGSPPGLPYNSVQFNYSGSYSGSELFTYESSSGLYITGSIFVSGGILSGSASYALTASYFGGQNELTVGNVLVFGSETFPNRSDLMPRYLYLGYDDGEASKDEINVYIPVAGTLSDLYIRHNTAGDSLGDLTYTIRKNGVDTALFVTMDTGDSAGSNVADSVAIAAGDYISLQVNHALDGFNAPRNIQASLQFKATAEAIYSSSQVFNSLVTFNAGIRTRTTRVTSSNYTVQADDYRIGVKYTLTGSCDLQLPAVSAVPYQDYKVKDEEGNASINNINFLGDGTDTIDGLSTGSLTGNYHAITLYNNGTSSWFIE